MSFWCRFPQKPANYTLTPKGNSRNHKRGLSARGCVTQALDALWLPSGSRVKSEVSTWHRMRCDPAWPLRCLPPASSPLAVLEHIVSSNYFWVWFKTAQISMTRRWLLRVPAVSRPFTQHWSCTVVVHVTACPCGRVEVGRFLVRCSGLWASWSNVGSKRLCRRVSTPLFASATQGQWPLGDWIPLTSAYWCGTSGPCGGSLSAKWVLCFSNAGSRTPVWPVSIFSLAHPGCPGVSVGRWGAELLLSTG